MKEKTASYIKNEPCVDTNSTCPGGTLSTVSQNFFNYTILNQMIVKLGTDFVLILAKMTTLLKEMRIAQLSS